MAEYTDVPWNFSDLTKCLFLCCNPKVKITNPLFKNQPSPAQTWGKYQFFEKSWDICLKNFHDNRIFNVSEVEY